MSGQINFNFSDSEVRESSYESSQLESLVETPQRSPIFQRIVNFCLDKWPKILRWGPLILCLITIISLISTRSQLKESGTDFLLQNFVTVGIFEYFRSHVRSN